jgi:hypothetical protein
MQNIPKHECVCPADERPVAQVVNVFADIKMEQGVAGFRLGHRLEQIFPQDQNDTRIYAARHF